MPLTDKTVDLLTDKTVDLITDSIIKEIESVLKEDGDGTKH